MVAAEGSGGEAGAFEASEVGYGKIERFDGVEVDFSKFRFQGGVVTGAGEKDQDIGFQGVDFVAEEALLGFVDFGDFGPGAVGDYGAANVDLEQVGPEGGVGRGIEGRVEGAEASPKGRVHFWVAASQTVPAVEFLHGSDGIFGFGEVAVGFDLVSGSANFRGIVGPGEGFLADHEDFEFGGGPAVMRIDQQRGGGSAGEAFGEVAGLVKVSITGLQRFD